MDYDKNTIIAFVLIFLVLIGYWWMNAPNPQQRAIENQPVETLASQDSLPDRTVIEQPEVKQPLAESPKKSEVTKATNDRNFPFLPATKANSRKVVIESDLYRSVISSRGATVTSWQLKKYAKANSEKVSGLYKAEDWVELIGPNPGFENFFKTQYHEDWDNYDYDNLGLSFPTKRGTGDTGPLEFEIVDNREAITLTKDHPVDSLVFRLMLANEGFVEKKFKFYYGKYDFDLVLDFYQLNDLLESSFYKLEWRSGLSPTESDVSDEMTYTKGYECSGNTTNDFDVLDEDDELKPITGKIQWIGTTTKYFGVSIIPQFIDPNDDKMLEATIEGRNIKVNETLDYDWKKFNISYKTPFYSNEKYVPHTYKVFIGPLDYFVLKTYDNRLEKLVNMGYSLFRPIAVAALYAFTNLHKVIPNYGLVIIIFSILVKILLHPLTKKSYASMKKMQELQPELNALKEKHSDPKKLQQAQMRLYKEKGVNPVGGCLPMLLQMPLLIALYWVFRNTIELRGEPFIWWITDLSMPDTIFTLPFTLPMYGNHFNVLPILMGVTMIFQQKMTSTDPKQKALVYIMPVFMVLIFNRLSSGLNLYYTLFNVFSMIQQHFSKTKEPSDTATEEVKAVPVETKTKSLPIGKKNLKRRKK